MEHKFAIGQTVYYTSGMIGRHGGSGNYQIVRLLPYEGGDFQYRIKGTDETYERVAKESQLEVA